MEIFDHIGQLISFRITPDFVVLCYIAYQLHKRLTRIEDNVEVIEKDVAHIQGHLGIKDAA